MRTVLLHVCCAPCATHPHRRLAGEGRSTVLFFYNPNLHPREEHDKRLAEAERYAREVGLKIIAPAPDFEGWADAVRGLEDEPEGGARCAACFAFRLGATAARAKAGRFDAFASTLSVGPRKNPLLIDRAGLTAAADHGVEYLPSDFKKKGGFQESVRLSKVHGLYRQSYCGCRFSIHSNHARTGNSQRDRGTGTIRPA